MVKKTQSQILAELRKEKSTLLKAVQKKEAARKKKEQLAREEAKLKKEIANLKKRGKRNVISILGQRVASPSNKKKAKKLWKNFRDFADNMPD